jgi:hypothetical protein
VVNVQDYHRILTDREKDAVLVLMLGLPVNKLLNLFRELCRFTGDGAAGGKLRQRFNLLEKPLIPLLSEVRGTFSAIQP